MATAPDPNEDDTLELTADDELQPGPDDEPVEGEEPPSPDEEGEEETIVSFGEPDDAQPDDSSEMRRLRERNKDLNKRVRELESSSPKPATIEIGEKPQLADFDYDEDAYDKARDEWQERKDAAAAQERQQQEARAEADRAWEGDVAAFNEKRAKLAPSVPDFDDLQQTVASSLDLAQQAVLVKAASDPALFMVALAKNPAKLAELAKTKDVIKLAAAIARMEGGIKVVTKRKAPAPDRALSGSAAVPGDADKTMEKLEKEAERTGDRSKVIAYKRQQKAKATAK